MSTAEEIEKEIDRQRTTESAPKCPLVQIELCGRMEMGPNAQCLNCQTAHLFFGEFVSYYKRVPPKKFPPILQDEIDQLIEAMKQETGNVVNDEYVKELFVLFVDKTAEYIEKNYQSLEETPTGKLLFLHSLKLLKERLKTFSILQDPDIDHGMRAVVEYLIKSIKEEIIDS